MCVYGIDSKGAALFLQVMKTQFKERNEKTFTSKCKMMACFYRHFWLAYNIRIIRLGSETPTVYDKQKTYQENTINMFLKLTQYKKLVTSLMNLNCCTYFSLVSIQLLLVLKGHTKCFKINILY